MRDVVTGFYRGTLAKLIASGEVSVTDRVLVVCGGELDRAVMASIGFLDFTITGLNSGDDRQDAENLTYPDGAFDLVVVHAGLHHCYSPHRALLEMYRVARKAVIAFEARDSFLMRVAIRLGLTLEYETDSITHGRGGVAATGIPNFIYRWTERDVRSAIASCDPTRVPTIKYFYDLRLPIQRFTRSGKHSLRLIGLLIEPLSRIVAAIAPTQCNEFAFAISKSGAVHPWISPP